MLILGLIEKDSLSTKKNKKKKNLGKASKQAEVQLWFLHTQDSAVSWSFGACPGVARGRTACWWASALTPKQCKEFVRRPSQQGLQSLDVKYQTPGPTKFLCRLWPICSPALLAWAAAPWVSPGGAAPWWLPTSGCTAS